MTFASGYSLSQSDAENAALERHAMVLKDPNILVQLAAKTPASI